MKLHYFKAKKEKHGLLYQVFVVVAIIQITLLVTFSSYIVSQSIIEDQVFEAPPSTEKIEPAQQEHRVRVERQRKKSSNLTKRIQISNPSQINTPEINVTLPASIMVGGGISTTTNIEMKGKFDIMTTSVELFDIRSKTEKVLICIDTGSYLMTEARGGLDTYKVIREDIKNLVNKLPSTVLFNLMAFDTSRGGSVMNFFQSTLVSATNFNKRIAADWIDPLNATLKTIGAGRNNYTLKFPFLPQPPRSPDYNPAISNIYRIYQAALEQGADTIFILTTGWVDWDKIKQPWTDSEINRYRRAMENYDKEVARQRKAAGWTDEKQQEYDNAVAKARAEGIKKARDWIKDENERRQKKGLSLYTGTPEQAMRENKFFVPPKEKPPSIKVKKPVAEFKSYGKSGVLKFYEPLFKKVYFEKNMRAPTVNMILFRGKDEQITPAEQRVIREFTNANNSGRSRVLKGITPVNE